jgi:hypothetical protein
MTLACPACRSTYLTLALETPTRRFFICGGCAHRWNEVAASDEQRPASLNESVASRSTAKSSYRQKS